MDVVEVPLGRREKRKQEIRTRIEDAAYRLFKDQGVDETSIEQICVEADVARRTFYGHFANKHALLGAHHFHAQPFDPRQEWLDLRIVVSSGLLVCVSGHIRPRSGSCHACTAVGNPIKSSYPLQGANNENRFHWVFIVKPDQ